MIVLDLLLHVPCPFPLSCNRLLPQSKAHPSFFLGIDWEGEH